MKISRHHLLIDSISTDEKQSSIAFSWLLILRWGALFCQALLVLTVYLFFRIKTPLPILSAIIIFEGASNLFFHYLFQKTHRPIPGGLFVLVMFLDIALLTAMLHYTGGPMNPFTFLFLVHICLGAILMRPGWAWGLAAFTTLCYAGLFFTPNPPSGGSPPPCHPGPAGLIEDNLALHLQGMWFAFAITAFFVVFFVGKIQMALEEHQKTLADLEREKTRSEKLGSLATLAAGAAHEFSTPLATIAVAAGEMMGALQEKSADPELISDTRLIRTQVERCRDILYQMAADAGEHLAEGLREFSVTELMDDVLCLFPPAIRQQVTFASEVENLVIRMPFRTLKRIIRGLIKNSLEASAPDRPVRVTCRKDDHFLFFEIEDQGEGMDQETLAKAIEPFFTTKEPGKGLGLGLYLADSAATRFGGRLKLYSRPGKGTRAVLSFALDQIQTHPGTIPRAQARKNAPPRKTHDPLHSVG